MAYASALLRDPAQTYRRIDAAGRTATADAPALVQLLYDELVGTLRAAAFATEQKRYALKGDRVQRATAILFALDAGLDFENGGEISTTLARLYAGARTTVLKAALGDDPAPFRETATMLEEIGAAWRQARAG
jgi:flagellar secretion chaperone FliS